MDGIEASSIEKVSIQDDSMELMMGEGLLKIGRPRRIRVNGERLLGNRVVREVESYRIVFEDGDPIYKIRA